MTDTYDPTTARLLSLLPAKPTWQLALGGLRAEVHISDPGHDEHRLLDYRAVAVVRHGESGCALAYNATATLTVHAMVENADESTLIIARGEHIRGPRMTTTYSFGDHDFGYATLTDAMRAFESACPEIFARLLSGLRAAWASSGDALRQPLPLLPFSATRES